MESKARNDRLGIEERVYLVRWCHGRNMNNKEQNLVQSKLWVYMDKTQNEEN